MFFFFLPAGLKVCRVTVSFESLWILSVSSQQILQFKSRPLHRGVLMPLSCIAGAKRAAAAQLATIIPQMLKIVEDDWRYFSGPCPRLSQFPRSCV